MIQEAKQGGFQPAEISGLKLILEEGDTFQTNKNHIDYPEQTLVIPKDCIGVVENYQHMPKEGTVTVLWKDTITARRLISIAAEKTKTLK